ncbi:MAG: LysR family transcriptional regulator substrate-binding protein [Oscillospiraceae bacterium]
MRSTTWADDAQRVKLFECPQEIVIVASPKHPFAAAKQLKLADLVNEPFVLMPQFNSYRHQFDMELAHQKLSIRPFLELESTSMVMQLLEHNPVPVRAAALHGAPPRGRGPAPSFCQSWTATWSSGASWCTTATRCSRRRSAPWSPALRRWKKYRCISRD